MPSVVRSQQDSIVSYSDNLTFTTPASLRSVGGYGDSLQPVEVHLSLGSTVVGGKWGSASAFGVTPSIVFRPNERLAVRASLTTMNSYSLMPSGYALRGREQRSLAPVRNYNGAAVALNVAAAYKVNDRLWVAGSLMHVVGGLASAALVNPWLAADMPMMLDATAFSASMRYRVGEKSYLDLHLMVARDRTGALGPLMYGNPWGGYCGAFNPYYGSLLDNPFGNFTLHGAFGDM